MSIVSLPTSFVSPRRAETPAGRREQLEAVSEQFEALFLQQILKQMRKAGDVLSAGSPMRSRELDTLRDFHDELLAETLAGKRQTGITDMLVKQLSGDPTAAGLAETVIAGGELPRAGAASLEPLRATWHRGGELLSSAWEQGSAGFRALVDSLISQESSGNPDAVSPKGARGLMQLMPDTAREMAAELGLDYSEERLTRDPAYNRQLGTAYLNKMLDRYDGNRVLALAAYNAGPGKVDEWLQANGDPRSGRVGIDDWIQRIPYPETRDYTRNILRNLEAAAPQPGPAQGAFKPAAEPVALQSGQQQIPSASAHQARSAAFAQSIRIENQEKRS
ncbi:lytic transglycosylase domain-containing protein [Pseudomonas sp. Q1-7]|uniref:lytic transglycosylase domain-containing protein n=1 Tax=Pseudomonas sp. Q1-7 TaxID=3020843 RepID=UPI002301E54D|nr:transglycosylase SLT domain-containing protein [Pseudomonas sp. Q1-7]